MLSRRAIGKTLENTKHQTEDGTIQTGLKVQRDIQVEEEEDDDDGENNAEGSWKT